MTDVGTKRMGLSEAERELLALEQAGRLRGHDLPLALLLHKDGLTVAGIANEAIISLAERDIYR